MPNAYESDIDPLGDWLDGVIAEIGWDMPAGPEGSTSGAAATLGETAIEVITDGIQARSLASRGADALGSDDAEWPENHPRYRDRKERLYGQQNPNFRTTQMLSRESIRGESAIGHDEVSWQYGTGLPSPDGKTKHDRTVTDRQKAHYAETGQSEHDIRRPFFAVAEQDADDVLICVESAVAALFERKATEP